MFASMLVALAIAPWGTAVANPHKLPDDVKTLLEKADVVELISLSPEADKTDKAFRGWTVLGRTELKEADATKKALPALEKGIEDNDGSSARCFLPRHAIRAKHGDKSVDLLICFQCQQIRIYRGTSNEPETILTTNSPQATLDELLKAAGVKLAEKPKD